MSIFDNLLAIASNRTVVLAILLLISIAFIIWIYRTLKSLDRSLNLLEFPDLDEADDPIHSTSTLDPQPDTLLGVILPQHMKELHYDN
jgi:hypothetical protein